MHIQPQAGQSCHSFEYHQEPQPVCIMICIECVKFLGNFHSFRMFFWNLTDIALILLGQITQSTIQFIRISFYHFDGSSPVFFCCTWLHVKHIDSDLNLFVAFLINCNRNGLARRIHVDCRRIVYFNSINIDHIWLCKYTYTYYDVAATIWLKIQVPRFE